MAGAGAEKVRQYTNYLRLLVIMVNILKYMIGRRLYNSITIIKIKIIEIK